MSYSICHLAHLSKDKIIFFKVLNSNGDIESRITFDSKDTRESMTFSNSKEMEIFNLSICFSVG